MGYVAVVAVAVAVTAGAIDRFATALLAHQAPVAQLAPRVTPRAVPLPSERRTASLREPLGTSAPMSVVSRGGMVTTNDDWATKLLDPAFWAKNKAGSGKGGSSKSQFSAPAWLGAPPAAPAAPPVARSSRGAFTETSNDDQTYRTVCVRLCDGAFFPVSFSTTREQFEADAAKCEKTCAGGRLFTYANPGGELDDMQDLNGNAYKRLSTAFLFRTSYNEQCKCRAHPWEETARDQHRVYALEAQRARGDRKAVSEISALNAKLKQAGAEATAAAKLANARLQNQLSTASRATAGKRLASGSKATTFKANASGNGARVTAR